MIPWNYHKNLSSDLMYEEIQQSKIIPHEIKDILSNKKNRKHIDLSLSIDYKQTNITKKEVKKILNNIRQTDSFFKSLSFYPGIIDTITELNKIFNIYFVSKPSENIASNSESIKRHLIEKTFWYENGTKKLVLIHDKTMRSGDVLVDDSPDIDQWIVKPNRTHILMDQTHNQDIKKPRLYIDQQERRKWIIKENLHKKDFMS